MIAGMDKFREAPPSQRTISNRRNSTSLGKNHWTRVSQLQGQNAVYESKPAFETIPMNNRRLKNLIPHTNPTPLPLFYHPQSFPTPILQEMK